MKMKISGVTRHIDKLGRLVIPKDIRYSLNWQEDTALEISQFGHYLLLCAAQDRQNAPIELGTASPILDEIMMILPKLSDQDGLLILELMQRLAQIERAPHLPEE